MTEVPITEASNAITEDIDVASAGGTVFYLIIRLLVVLHYFIRSPIHTVL